MELSQAIRFAYYNKLEGNLISNDLPVPIYDAFAIPEGVTKPYVLLSTQTSFQRNLKRFKMYNASILIDIVTGGSNNLEGRIQAEEISDVVELFINPDTFEDIDLTMYGYHVGNTTREGDTDSSLMNGTEYIYRKLIRYEHIVTKIERINI